MADQKNFRLERRSRIEEMKYETWDVPRTCIDPLVADDKHTWSKMQATSAFSPKKSLDVTLQSDDDVESGSDSCLTDEEWNYQEEAYSSEDDEEFSPYGSPEEAGSSEDETSSGVESTPRRRGHGWPRARPRTLSHSKTQSTPTSRRGRRFSRKGRSRSRSRSRSPLWPQSPLFASATSWKTENELDICPSPQKFIPARTPGHQLNPGSSYSPLDLFKLFISDSSAQTICENTNKQAAKNIANGKKYSWTAITTQEFYKYLGLTFFFALVKLDDIKDYWRKNTIYSVPFPANVMPRDRYRAISWNIHMSDPAKDVENDKKKGTPEYDRLFRLKPFLDTIKDACKAFYHPRQNLSVDERMVATKARTGMTQYIKAKPTKWGMKLFVLADSSNGYTLDFSVYTGKSEFATAVGLSYDAVMSLIKPNYLGSGFHLFVDNFYTSPKLFRDLFNVKIGACGTYKSRKDAGMLTKRDPRGSIRWFRDGPIVFVKWLDSREVAICSTIHQAYSGSTVNRRVKDQDGNWVTKPIPCPTPIMDYNKNMGGVDLSDQLIQYYSVHHKTMRWYRTLFLHFLDIAATNSYLLYKELCREKQEVPMTHRAFVEELTAQLCGVTVAVPSARAHCDHIPVPIAGGHDTSKRASYGRRTCIHCRQTRKAKQCTPWKCKECDVPLCLIPDRNCFEAWHT